MEPDTIAELAQPSRAESDRLNRSCFCVTLDREALRKAAEREEGGHGFWDDFAKTRPHLFSNVPVFLPPEDLASMATIVSAIEAAAALPEYQKVSLGWAPPIAIPDHGPIGAFMGYDFHLGADGPKLIEVNTNAGGAFLNAILARAQRACCAEVEMGFDLRRPDTFDAAALAMFRGEWLRQRGDAPLRRIAIVDERPQEQYLYPEFVLARQQIGRAHV